MLWGPYAGWTQTVMFIDDLKSFNKEKAQLAKPEELAVNLKVKEEPTECDLKPLFEMKTDALDAAKAIDLKIKEEECFEKVSSVKNLKRQSSSMMQSPAPKAKSNKKKRK